MAAFDPERDEIVPERVVIRMAVGTGIQDIEELLGRYDVREMKRRRRTVVVTFGESVDVKRIIAELKKSPHVEDASPEFVKRLARE